MMYNALKSFIIQYTRAPLICTICVYTCYSIYINYILFLANIIGDNNKLIYTISFFLVKIMCCVLINGFFFYIEYNNIFLEYKIYRNEYQLPSKKLMVKNLLDTLIGFILLPFITYYILYDLFSKPECLSTLPNYIHIYISFASFYLINDWGFYITHRILHTKYFYKYHKQHHSYIGPVSYSAEYAHIFEKFTSNYIPTLGGLVLIKTHQLISFIWLIARLEQTYEVHSGYCFKNTFLYKLGLTNSDGALYHDLHHTNNNVNFGGPFYIDYLVNAINK